MTTVNIEFHLETAEKIRDIVLALENAEDDPPISDAFLYIRVIIEELIKQKPILTDSEE